MKFQLRSPEIEGQSDMGWAVLKGYGVQPTALDKKSKWLSERVPSFQVNHSVTFLQTWVAKTDTEKCWFRPLVKVLKMVPVVKIEGHVRKDVS